MDSKSSPADQARDAAVEEKEVVNQEVTDKEAITKLDTSEVIETVVTKSEQNLEDKFVVEVMTAPEENSKAPDSEVHAVNGVKEEINISTPPEPTTKIITDDESKNTENISGAIEAQNEEASETPAVPIPASETETKLEELPSAYTENRSTETFNGKELVVEDKASFDALKEDNSPSKMEDENKKVEEAVAIESSKETIADVAECKAVEEIPVADSVDAPKEVDKVEEPVKEVPTGDVFSDPSANAALSEVTDVTPVTGTAKDNGNPEHTVEEEKQENSMKDEEPILITEDKLNAIAVGLQVPEVPSEEVKASEDAVLFEEKKDENLGGLDIAAASNGDEKTSEGAEPFKETKDDETTLDASAIVVEASSTVEEKTSEGSEVVETKDESLNDEKTAKASEEAVQDLEKKDENLESQEEISATADASIAVVESLTGQEKSSECTEIVKEKKDESSKDDHETISVKASEEAVSEGQEEISRNLDAPTIVAEVSTGVKTSESTEIVKETKDESSKDDETTLDASAIVVEASAEEVKTCESSEIVETKDESLNDEKTTKASEEAVMDLEKKDEKLEGLEEISKNPDASSVEVESSTGEEKISECTESVKETKDGSSKDEEATAVKASEEAVLLGEKKDDEHVEGQEEISKNLDAPIIVAEISTGEKEKTSESSEIVKETMDEISKDAKTTLVDASAVDTATEVVEISSEEKKDSEDHSTTLDITANDSDVAPAAEVAPQEEKISEGDELVDVKKNNEAKTSECAKLDDGNKFDTLDPVEIAKELDVKERNTPAAFLESTDGAEGGEKHKEAVEDNEETEKLIETNSVEPSKDSDVAKKDRETAAKQDAPVKPSQRHSNNIISKVKHSIVKVKKAIIGKSPSSKTMSAGDKNDIKVK
ncbi:uncharacterized protein [Typha latifolia]|uniref:uncharacterized protein n=1 Tax=Typha latifolia TaxID=4733 RepID=UPI003C30CCFE